MTTDISDGDAVLYQHKCEPIVTTIGFKIEQSDADPYAEMFANIAMLRRRAMRLGLVGILPAHRWNLAMNPPSKSRLRKNLKRVNRS